MSARANLTEKQKHTYNNQLTNHEAKIKGLWLDLKYKDVYSAAKVRCKILIMTLSEIGE